MSCYHCIQVTILMQSWFAANAYRGMANEWKGLTSIKSFPHSSDMSLWAFAFGPSTYSLNILLFSSLLGYRFWITIRSKAVVVDFAIGTWSRHLEYGSLSRRPPTSFPTLLFYVSFPIYLFVCKWNGIPLYPVRVT